MSGKIVSGMTYNMSSGMLNPATIALTVCRLS